MTFKVDDRKFREIVGNAKKLGEAHVRVGVFDGEIARIATIHEFGAPGANIPERSFIRSTLTARRGELEALQKRVAKGVATGKLGAQRGHEMLGAWAVRAIKDRIIDGSGFEPLAWSTLHDKVRRGKTKILIDTGQLVASISYKVANAAGSVLARLPQATRRHKKK